MGYGGYIWGMEGIYGVWRVYRGYGGYIPVYAYIYIPFAFLLLCNHPLPHHLYLLYLKFNSLITFSTLNHTLFATLILSLKLFTFILTFTLSINYIFLFHFCDFIHT